MGIRYSYCLMILLALLLTACSTSNVGTVGTPSDDSRGASFAVTAEGDGVFTPRIEVEEGANGALVTVFADNAADLTSVYMNVTYDTSRYSPESVDFAEFLGSMDDVLTLAITNQRGVVPLGMAQIGERRLRARSGEGEVARIRFANRPFADAREIAGLPMGAANAVDDLVISSQTATEATLRWTEKNKGDYDNNGEVSISDLTPVGLLFNTVVESAADPVWAGMVDGDGNGVINLADLTPIGMNYGNKVVGYVVYVNAAGTDPIDAGDCSCGRDAHYVDNKTPVEYEYVADLTSLSGSIEFTVRPVDVTVGSSGGELSNVAEVVDVPGAPDAPTNLAAQTGETIGSDSVKLTWTKSTHRDVGAYEIWRKLTSEDELAWTVIYEVGGSASTYTDSGADQQGESYDYKIRARDFTGLYSDYTDVVSATPWFMPPPSPPENLAANNQIAQSLAILLTWNAPSDGSALRFFVYQKGPADADFEQIGSTQSASQTNWFATGLVAGETYEYYVKSFGVGGALSDPSNTVSEVPSAESNIVITDLTTDKTTHCDDASEPASNLTVTCDLTPDSVDWTATAGVVTGSGETATYKPTNGQAPGKVVVTCTVHKGSNSDSATINLYVTTESIMTEYGNNGHYIEGAPKLSGGATCPTLETLISGGARVENRNMSYYMTQDHVTWFCTFDIS